MLRNILAVFLGLAAAVVTIFLVETVSSHVYPPPADLDMNNPDAMKNYMSNLPAGAYIFVLVAWALGAFAGGLVATFISKTTRLIIPSTVAGLLVIAAIINMLTIPHPVWVWVLGILLFVPFTLLGYKMVKPRQESIPEQ